MKFLIFDAGPIISLTMNGLLPVLEKLKKEFNGKFIITPNVKREIVDRPLKIKKYELEGIKVQELIDNKTLSLSSEFIPNQKLESETKKLMKKINSSFEAKEKINLVQEGEVSCLVFAKLCNCENLIVIDERVTRMLTEAPERIEKLMERKLHADVHVNLNNLKELKNLKFIRSSELLYIAYKKNLFEFKKTKALLDALLYAVKFKGAAISSKEISDMKKLA